MREMGAGSPLPPGESHSPIVFVINGESEIRPAAEDCRLPLCLIVQLGESEIRLAAEDCRLPSFDCSTQVV